MECLCSFEVPSSKILVNYRRKNSSVIVERPSGHHFAWAIEVKVTPRRRGDTVRLLKSRTQEVRAPLLGKPLRERTTLEWSREILGHTQKRGIPQNSRLVLFKNVKIMKDKGRLKNWPGLEELREIAKCSARWDFGLYLESKKRGGGGSFVGQFGTSNEICRLVVDQF